MVLHNQDFYKNKRVLITGGAGFIGSHLAKKLVEYQAHVSIIDNFVSGNLTNLTDVLHCITMFYGDIRTKSTIMRATSNKDIVFHTAALTSVPESFNHQDTYHAVNVDGTKNVLDACVTNNVKSMIFSSSSAVYGNTERPCTESDTPNPQSPYAQNKLDAEQLCTHFASPKLSTANLRYFNVYGPGQRTTSQYASVVARFTQQLINKQPVTIFGDGLQRRDFIHVDQVVQANLLAGTKEHLRGEIINVASGKSITLLTLLENLERELGITRVSIEYFPARSGDIISSQAHCNKLQALYCS